MFQAFTIGQSRSTVIAPSVVMPSWARNGEQGALCTRSAGESNGAYNIGSIQNLIELTK